MPVSTIVIVAGSWLVLAILTVRAARRRPPRLPDPPGGPDPGEPAGRDRP